MYKIPSQYINEFVYDLSQRTMSDPAVARKWSNITGVDIDRAYVWQWRDRLGIEPFNKYTKKKGVVKRRIEDAYPRIGREIKLHTINEVAEKYNLAPDSVRRAAKRMGITKQDRRAAIIDEIRRRYDSFDRASPKTKFMVKKYPSVCIAEAFGINICIVNAYKLKYGIGPIKSKRGSNDK